MTRSLAPQTYRDQWAWKKIGLERAWKGIAEAMPEHHAYREQITVAIVDSGIKTNHEVSVETGNSVPFKRVIPPRERNCGDDDGHGTMLAGTMAGVINPLCRAPAAVSPIHLLGVKFIDWRTPPMSRHAAAAIRSAVEK